MVAFFKSRARMVAHVTSSPDYFIFSAPRVVLNTGTEVPMKLEPIIRFDDSVFAWKDNDVVEDV